jgi:hypothetical protein
MNPHLRSHLAVLAAFIAATILVTWPMAIQITSGVPYGGDSYQFVWNGWWFAKALADPSLSLWHTPYQYAPIGASLALHDLSPFNALFQAWFRPFAGDFGAFNILILIHYVLGAWGAYILAWYLTGNRAGSVIAGVIYGFSTFHAMHLSQLSTVSSGWLPLGVYYLIKYTRDGGVRDGALAILMILASALSSWYHFVFLAIVFFGFMAIGQIGLRDNLGGHKRWTRAVTPWIMAVAILSPLLIMAIKETDPKTVEWLVDIGGKYYIDPAFLILPPPTHPIFGMLSTPFKLMIPGNATEGVASLGLAAIALGIMSWFKRGATTRVWCWLGLILFLLALGPTVTILAHETGIPGPFRLWSMIPILDLVRVPARFMEPFTLTLGIGAACTIGSLDLARVNGKSRAFFLWVIPIVIMMETLVIPIPLVGSKFDYPVLHQLTKIYQETTGETKGPHMMINFPPLPERREFLYQQTIHQIPTVDGGLSNPPAGARDFLMDFNWNPDFLRSSGIDLVLYHRWIADKSPGDTFDIPDVESAPEKWRGKSIAPDVFFKEVMRLRIAYEDENVTVFIP